MIQITKVTKEQAKLRLALAGPSGSGKTYSALSIATAMGGKICLFDTEYGSAAKYANLFDFDGALIEKDYHPDRFVEAIKAAETAGYDIVIVDSLSHAWNGPGGVLELVTAATKRKNGNSYAAWDDVTPIYRRLIHSIMSSRCHVIVGLRAKQDYLQEKDTQGRTQIRKVGMAPEIREGFAYEMDIEGLLDIDHCLVIGKTRCETLDGKIFTKPGKEFADIVTAWLSDGAPATEEPTEPVVIAPVKSVPEPEPVAVVATKAPPEAQLATPENSHVKQRREATEKWMTEVQPQLKSWDLKFSDLPFLKLPAGKPSAETIILACMAWSTGIPPSKTPGAYLLDLAHDIVKARDETAA